VPAGDAELICAALRRADGHLAVVDPDHRFRSGLHEGYIIQAMAALQVHHHRREPQYPPQHVTFGLDERGAGSSPRWLRC
jgi:hypothetical protein